MSERRHCVLVVDDEQEILDSLRRTLRNEPYEVLTTTSPSFALERIAAGDVDLLLSDIDMPEMTGVELVARVRRSHPEVVRLLLTGDASLQTALRAINDGEVLRYLTKPWDKEELRATLRSALQRLDELRRASRADRIAGEQRQLLVELEAEHPVIQSFSLVDGEYEIDVDGMQAVIAGIDSPRLRALFSARSPAAPTKEESGESK